MEAQSEGKEERSNGDQGAKRKRSKGTERDR